MAPREDQLLTHIDERKLGAIGEHGFEGGRIDGAHTLFVLCCRSASSWPRLSRPSTSSSHEEASKTWMPGIKPGMTEEAAGYVACCGVIWCTSPVLRSMRMRVILSRLVPVTRTKRA